MKDESKPKTAPRATPRPTASKSASSASARKELAALKDSAVNKGHTKGSAERVKARIAALEGAA